MLNRRTWAGLAVLAPLALIAAEDQGLSQRGMALIQKPGSASYSIVLERDGQVAEVPDNFPFRTGDRLSIKIDLKKSAYVYVLNRTLSGAPDKLEGASRGMALLANPASAPVAAEQQNLQAQQVEASPFTVVYPARGHILVPAGRVTIPPDAHLVMDNRAGLEKLYVVISPTKLPNLVGAVGRLTGAQAPAVQSQTQQEIRSILTGMAHNTESAEPPMESRQIRLSSSKPISSSPQPVKPQQQKPRPNSAVAAPVSAQKPYMVELSLLHR